MPSQKTIDRFKHTSKSTGAGGGGKVDLSTFRLVAFSLPVFVLAFFPMMINKRDITSTHPLGLKSGCRIYFRLQKT